MDGQKQLVSILIPNFNNGQASSISGRRNFIDDLFRSLHETLLDDPTPVEIIVVDDGSTDDSLPTCRRWSEKTWGGWRGESPFCKLIEQAHCGVLSIVANKLMEEARGNICCRLDGDIVIHTRNWASILCAAFQAGPPDLGVIGPLQLAPDGFVHAAGDWILHPRGYHHVAQGIAADRVTRSVEVDHVMGCFYCMKREVWNDVGEYDETILRGQTVDFGLQSRLKGWRCISIPTISFTHYHPERQQRDNVADSDAGVFAGLDRFHEKWGFDRLAPDLDEVAERYAGTSLLWNSHVFGPVRSLSTEPRQQRTIEQTAWGTFGNNEQVQQIFNARLSITQEYVLNGKPSAHILHVQCRDGLLCHLISQQGASCTGVDPDESLLEIAQQATSRAQYSGTPPVFLKQDDSGNLPVDDQSFDAVLLFDIIERHPNPVRLLTEAHRVLGEDGVVIIITPPRISPLHPDVDSLHAYRAHELNGQIHYLRLFNVITPAEASPTNEMLFLVARRQ